MQTAEELETDGQSWYSYRATFIQKVLQGQEVNFAQEGNSSIVDEVDDKLLAFDNPETATLLKRILTVVDFIDDLAGYRDNCFYDIFVAFFDIDCEKTKFMVSDALLAQLDGLSPDDCQQVRKQLSEFDVRDYKLHNYLLDLLETNPTLGGVIQALASASGSFAAHYLKTLNTYGKKKCKLVGEICLGDYDFHQYQEDLQDYNEWLSNYAPINFEDELSRKMGYYMDKLYQTDYLKPYRDSVVINLDQIFGGVYYDRYPYRYNYRGFLEPTTCDDGYTHDLFLWKKHELVEFTILRKRFQNLEYDAVELGKLIIENRANYSESNVKTLIACLKFYHKIKSSLHEVIAANDELVSRSQYHHYLKHMNIKIPEKMTSDKAYQVWYEFSEEKYMVGRSSRFVWTRGNNREFGYFVYYAHRFFYKQHAKDETINWDAYCFFFSQDTNKKKSFESGCSEIARIERSEGKKRLPETALRIKKIFRRIK